MNTVFTFYLNMNFDIEIKKNCTKSRIKGWRWGIQINQQWRNSPMLPISLFDCVSQLYANTECSVKPNSLPLISANPEIWSFSRDQIHLYSSSFAIIWHVTWLMCMCCWFVVMFLGTTRKLVNSVKPARQCFALQCDRDVPATVKGIFG